MLEDIYYDRIEIARMDRTGPTKGKSEEEMSTHGARGKGRGKMKSPTEVSHVSPRRNEWRRERKLQGERSMVHPQSPLFFKGQQIASSLMGYLPNSNFRSKGKKVRVAPPSSTLISSASILIDEDEGSSTFPLWHSLYSPSKISLENKFCIRHFSSRQRFYTPLFNNTNRRYFILFCNRVA